MKIGSKGDGSSMGILAVILATLLGSTTILGQSVSYWEAIASLKGELNVNIPSGSIIVSENNECYIYVDSGGVSFRVSKRAVGNPKEPNTITLRRSKV